METRRKSRIQSGTATVFPTTGTTVQYNDIFMTVASGKLPASHAPTWNNTFTANLGAYSFAVDDYIDISTAELMHDYVEGTDIEIHIHAGTGGTNVDDRGVKFQIFYAWSNPNVGGVGEVFVESNISAEFTIPANTPDRSAFYLSVGTISGAGKKIGSQLKTRIKRIAATGTAPTADPFLGQIGIHYQRNSLGSRTRSEK